MPEWCGATLGPDEAYRFARGEEVTSNTGLPVRLQRPLDFLVISDHAENLGLAPMIAESNPALLKNAWGKQVHDLVKAGKGLDAANMWAAAMQALQDPFKGQGDVLARPVWERLTAAAEKYNDPGKFTTIIGFSGPRVRTATTSTATSCSATTRASRTRSFRFPTTTPAIPRSCGTGWIVMKRRPAARCWQFRTTATCRTA